MTEVPTGVLLCNLGTPEAPRAPEVRRYLRQFLSDPRVIDIPRPVRGALLELVILPRRPSQSAHAYQKVWTEAGSPLLVHSVALRDAVASALPQHRVELGMRYGQPDVGDAFERLCAAGCVKIIVVPLYPQYASSSTGSTLQLLYERAAGLWHTPMLEVVPPFYDARSFIDAFVTVARPVLDEHQPEHVLMSFHGQPERHCHKGDRSGSHCLAKPDCCDAIGPVNAQCYRAHCYATARALAAGLALPDDGWSTSFQSRLGRTPWIRPFTDEVLPALVAKGVKRIAVMCPSFVADCLETLEEIAIRARDDWRAAGGEELWLVPSLNATKPWVDAVCGMIRARDADA
ncbi:MAG: ferrochelatase [Deltaproteobacteria bacterium]|nr:ferrochelatase [Deltaproteobacteria bacterium]MBK8718781.1 ferrochelatase [Deltaproteobacteria bacterium]MBP7286496.1 ferrochelatase [Nannocystaceae bacterium]